LVPFRHHIYGLRVAANRPIPGLAPAAQRVRSCAIELPKDVPFKDGAKDGLFRPLGTDPVSV